MAAYDQRTQEAAQRWGQALPEDTRSEAARLTEDAAAAARRRWHAWCAGEVEQPEEPEDLAALTMEASAMAQVPLAGTQHTVGRPDMTRF